MVREKIPGCPELFREEAPQASAADFGTLAGKSFDRTLWMLDARLADRRFNPQPVPHGADFAEWHAGLHHSERSRIHAEKHNAFRVATPGPEVSLVSAPGVTEGIVNMRYRGAELEVVESLAELSRGPNQLAGSAHFAIMTSRVSSRVWGRSSSSSTGAGDGGTRGVAGWSVSASLLWNLTLTIWLTPCSSMVTP